MRTSIAAKVAAAGIGAGTLIAALGLTVSVQPTRVVAFGEPIRQDDFLYTVVGVAKTKALGTGTARTSARGLFYVVSVEVANKALRVEYRWDPAIVSVVDRAGHSYQFSIDGQHALDASRPQKPTIAPGATARFQVAFDLPAHVDHPALAYSNGILMGDLFDGASYRTARVPLE